MPDFENAIGLPTLEKLRIGIIGLGYVGLPLAISLSRHFEVVGYDINADKINKLKRGIDATGEIDSRVLANARVAFTTDAEALCGCRLIIVTVPTPVNDDNLPDLEPLLSATRTIGRLLRPGQVVVYESTVYPGCTREECVPILEQLSQLKAGQDFFYGYSPERVNPGDKDHTIERINKVVSACDTPTLDFIESVYKRAIQAGTYRAPSIEVAEAAKVIENTQRDLNISFMNELSIIFHKLGIDTHDVIKTASTKWNFLPFYPGLVGGHCVGVDPWYLLHKAEKVGYSPEVILSGRRVNDSMPRFIASELVKTLIQKGCNPGNSRVLVLGLTFKENVRDIRNSKVVNLVHELKAFSVQVDVADHMADPLEARQLYKLDLSTQPMGPYDAVIVAVAHRAFAELTADDFTRWMPHKPVVFDLKGILHTHRSHFHTYWRL